jgi:hypothetical protein
VTLLPDGEVTAAGFYFSNNIGAAMNDTGIRRATTSTMVFDTASTERMRIEADGDVGIGTTGSVAFSAGSGLRIERAATATLRLQDTGAHGFEIRAAADAAEFFSANSKPFTFNGAASELMRIDASGNLLVGKTSANSASHGGEIRATGQVVASVDGSWVGLFNRETDDGEILRFKKDDVTVGSIGTSIGSTYIGGNGDGGLFFNGSSDFRPWNKSTQANADGVTDLGASNARFKDLHLSGDLITGGGGTSNTGEIQFVADSTRARIVGGYDSGGGGYLSFRTDTTGGSDIERVVIGNDGVLEAKYGVYLGGTVST